VKDKRHILVIRFSQLGDVAMTVPVIYSAAMNYPDVRITVLSCSQSRTFFEDLAPNVNFMAADLKNEYRGIKGLNALYRRLVAKQFTHVADLHSELPSNYLRMRFNLGKFHVEHLHKNKTLRKKLVRNQNKLKEPLPTQFESYKDVFYRLGFPISELTFTSLFSNEKGNLNMLPRIIGPKRSWEQWIGIAPFAIYEGKTYPKEKMEKVIRLLIDHYPKARFFLFGKGKNEDNTFPHWVQQMPQCVYVGWHLENMHQELILMNHLDVMISMDSANMHLSSLTNTPVVSIWGATDTIAGFLGYHQSEDNIVSLDLECRPCSIHGKKECLYKDYHCMKSILPDMIVEKVIKVLDKK